MVTELRRYNLGVEVISNQFSDNWWILCGLCCLLFSVKFDL